MSTVERIERRSATPRPATVLLLAPVGRDAEVTAEILQAAELEVETCADVDTLTERLKQGAGVVLVTAEALTAASMEKVATALASQPAWSEVPFMILIPNTDAARTRDPFHSLGKHAHVTLVERPIHVKTLVSATRTALRSRMRQYDVRDLMHQLERRIVEREELLTRERRHAERLSGLAEASLAIASSVSINDALQMITDEACRIIKGHVAVTSIRIEENELPRTIRAMSCGSQSRWAELADGEDGVFEELASGLHSTQRVEEKDLATNPLSRIIDPTGLRSVLLSPLQERAGLTIGVIALASQNVDAFTDDDAAVLTQLAHMASAAIQNARLYREAQAANQAKDDFLATLAHELRTPMTGILGWVQMLKFRDSQPEDVDTAIDMIESSTRIQVRLVEDLLDVSRIIAGKLRIDVSAVELGPVVAEVVETFRARAKERSVEIDMRLEGQPLSVLGDETRLHQIIWNLLSNAIKFTPQHGRVEIELARAHGSVTIRVTDSGQGISPEFLPHVFDRFRQADNHTTTRRESGLGLGLAIVRYLVELHSGTVQVLSEGEGLGATFIVTLPLLAVRFQGVERRVSPRAEVPKLDNVKVLVVDDDAAAGGLVAGVLTEFGAQVQAVTSVHDAVRELRHFEADVIISDIAMPGEDGYAFMRRLREIQPTLGREVRAMALTGYGRPDDRTRILASGFQWYMQKPVEAIELAHAIENLLKSSSQAS